MGRLLLLSATLVAAAALFDGYSLDTYPNPQVENTPCRFDRMCDPDRLLSDEAAGRIQAMIYDLERKPELEHQCGSETKGYQVVVALMNAMSVPFMQGKESYAEKMARGLHDRWGVGHAACNDGVVVLISIKDRYMFISRGAGMESVMSDEVVDAIIDRMRPLLRKKLYAEAISQCVLDIQDALDSKARAGSELFKHVKRTRELPSKDTIRFAIWAGLASLVGITVCCALYDGTSSRRSAWQEAKWRLVQLEAAQQAADNAGINPPGGNGNPGTAPVAIHMQCCPICLEDFPAGIIPTDEAAQPLVNNGTGEGATRTVILPCRHRFHLNCIDEWMGGQQRSKCPMCQTPAFKSDGSLLTGDEVRRVQRGEQIDGLDTAQQPRPQQWAPARNNPWYRGNGCFRQRRRYHYGGWTTYTPLGSAADARAQDVNFLLHSLHRRYPEAVTATALNQWTSNPSQLGRLGFSTDPAFTSTQPPAASRSGGGFGSKGRSGRFGGGRSGGGRGGGW